MANSPQSKKRARQQEVRRQNNAGHRSMVRTYIKKIVTKIDAGNYEEAQAAFVAATPIIDSSVGKGTMAKNKAARIKSRLNTRIKALKS